MVPVYNEKNRLCLLVGVSKGLPFQILGVINLESTSHLIRQRIVLDELVSIFVEALIVAKGHAWVFPFFHDLAKQSKLIFSILNLIKITWGVFLIISAGKIF